MSTPISVFQYPPWYPFSTRSTYRTPPLALPWSANLQLRRTGKLSSLRAPYYTAAIEGMRNTEQFKLPRKDTRTTVHSRVQQNRKKEQRGRRVHSSLALGVFFILLFPSSPSCMLYLFYQHESDYSSFCSFFHALVDLSLHKHGV